MIRDCDRSLVDRALAIVKIVREEFNFTKFGIPTQLDTLMDRVQLQTPVTQSDRNIGRGRS